MTSGQVDRARVGEIRPSQLIYGFGVGSVIDLPQFSALMMGLEDWNTNYCAPIMEERLLQAVQEELGSQVQMLYAPPFAEPPSVGMPRAFDQSRRIGVPVATFPRWFVCPACRLLTTLSSGLLELKTDHTRSDRTHYEHANCSRQTGGRKKIAAIPARFVIACENGHLDDFPWVEYVHGPRPCQARLKLSESGISGEAAQIFVECLTCGARRPMSDAFDFESGWKPRCTGRRPHLRDYVDDCEAQAKPVLLGASSSWFPLSLSVLSIPTRTNPLDQLITDQWGEAAEQIDSPGTIGLLRRLGNLGPLGDYSDEMIWAAIEERRMQSEEEGGEPADLRVPEWEMFTSGTPNHNSRDFRLRSVAPPPGFERQISDVVLVERLREVNALIGFTRIEAPGEFSEYSELPDERRAPLSRAQPAWVPASEVRGEGIFIRFSEAAIQEWVWTVPAIQRASAFREAHNRWRRMRGLDDDDRHFPGLRYVLIHSFAHALMRGLALECGYSGSSIRERLYVSEPGEPGGPMAGVLLYTAAPDSEGTLGGLVNLGEPEALRHYIAQALETAGTCASDPLCAEHDPDDGSTSVHAAACHACLFVPETSCERGNRYLDRAVLAKTFSEQNLAFFRGP